MMETKQFGLNRPQAKALLVNANKTYLVWGRGTGKTTGALGPKSLDLVHKMPRAKGGFIGKDYEQIFDRTLPEIVACWESLGYKRDQHWRIGKPLPDWDVPFVPPQKWDHTISWYNGTAISLLSLAVPGVGNGLSMQWIMGDEAKFWQQDRLKEVLKAVRGLKPEFGHLPEYLGQWFATDKWVDDIADIQWVLDKRKLMDNELIDCIYRMQLEVNKIRRQMSIMDEVLQASALEQIGNYETLMNALRKEAVYFSEASAYENEIILGKQYVASQKMDLPAEEFAVAIDNEDPKKSKSAFYPAIGEELHYYEGSRDINPSRQLIIALDYQASISPILVAQYNQLPGSMTDTLNFVREIYAKHPKGLKEALQQFMAMFPYHGNKDLIYVYDHTAIGKTPLGKSFKDFVVDELTLGGWIVTECFTGKAPSHGSKWEYLKNIYTNNNPLVSVPIRINKQHCPSLKISLERSRAISTGGQVTAKDKSHENTRRYPDYPQELATHFSDTHDQILHATHELQMIPLQGSELWAGGLV